MTYNLLVRLQQHHFWRQSANPFDRSYERSDVYLKTQKPSSNKLLEALPTEEWRTNYQCLYSSFIYFTKWTLYTSQGPILKWMANNPISPTVIPSSCKYEYLDKYLLIVLINPQDQTTKDLSEWSSLIQNLR